MGRGVKILLLQSPALQPVLLWKFKIFTQAGQTSQVSWLEQHTGAAVLSKSKTKLEAYAFN